MPEASISPQRYGQGRTFDEYLQYIASPENLARESNGGVERVDMSGRLREWHQAVRLSQAQAEAIRDLASQPGGPAKLLVIAEEWSSDCRRDVPMLAQLAEAGGMEMRIFNRDGDRFSGSPEPDPAESPNADLMAQFLNRKPGGPFQSVPIAVFYNSNFEYLYHYTEYPAIYQKDRVQGFYREPKPGETPEATAQRWPVEFGVFQQTPYFRVIACAGIDEIIAALHRLMLLGSV